MSIPRPLREHYVIETDMGVSLRTFNYIDDLEKYCEHLEQMLCISNSDNDQEPYFGWCNVEGCENEGANGGCCWQETGYWTVCSKHSQEYQEGKPQPKMKQWAIDKEKRRGPDGILRIE